MTYYEMNAQERFEMVVGMLEALKTEGALVEYNASTDKHGVYVTVTVFELDEESDTQNDLAFELWKVTEEGMEHERTKNGDCYTLMDEDEKHNYFVCEYECR